MVHGNIGTATSDTMYVSGGGISRHQLWGLGGNDILYGWRQADPNLNTHDELYGDRTPLPGEIQYDPNINPPGVPGDDIIYGGYGNDKIYGDGGKDFLIGDHLFGGFNAPKGNDRIEGGDGDDWVYGGHGNDILNGGNDQDFLSGAFSGSTSDIDELTGGFGADTFGLGYNGRSNTYIDYFGEGYALITDFNHWDGDRVRIGGTFEDYTLDYSANLGGLDALDTAIYRYGDLIAVLQDTTDVYSWSFI